MVYAQFVKGLISNMKKMVVTCFWDLSPSLENALEVALHFCHLGYDVRIFDGASVVSFREFDRSHKACSTYRFLRPLVRGVQIARKYGAISWQSYDGFEYYDELTTKGKRNLWNVSSFDEARRVKIDDFEVGAAALSSVIHVMNEVPSKDADFKNYRSLWVNVVKSGVEVYKYFEKVFEDESFEVATFNGRFVNDAAVVAAAHKKNRTWWLYENGPVLTHFVLFKSFPGHSISRHRAQMQSMFEQLKEEDLEEQGRSFFANKVSDINFNPFASSFKAGAKLDLKNQVESSKIVMFFQTSDDEYFSLDSATASEYSTDWYDQQELIIYLAEKLRDFVFVVRMHPHMAQKAKSYQDRWLKGTFPSNVEIVPFDSPVSSYDLLELGGPIVVVGSTVGLEAIFRKKPAIVAGATWWSNIDGAYEATTKAEVASLIAAYSELEVISNHGALMSGAYINSAFNGVPHRVTKRTGLYKALFDDVDLFKL